MRDESFQRLCARAQAALKGAPSLAPRYQDEWQLARAQARGDKEAARRAKRRLTERERRRRPAI